MDQIKEAFTKVKFDITFLKKEINLMKEDFIDIKKEIIELKDFVKTDNSKKYVEGIPTQNQENSTASTHSSTHNIHFKPLNPKILPISIGNEGVPTDKQTNRQTDKQTNSIEEINPDSIENAIEILNSLDSIKKEIRLKFKRLTEQEFLVFSTLYQLEESYGYSDYKSLAEKLNLTESSIRDYVGRLIKKGIPIKKNKINNKNIHLNIPQDLRKIATLPTILKLRKL